MARGRDGWQEARLVRRARRANGLRRERAPGALAGVPPTPSVVEASWRWVAGPGSGGYQRLALAHGLAAAGDALVALALAGSLFLAVPSAEARGNVLLYLAVTMAPFAVVAPLLGPLLDRHVGSGRLVLATAALGRAALAIAAAFLTRSVLLFAAALGMLVLSRAHGIARAGIVPAVARSQDELVAANARLSRVAVVGGTLAALPGAALLALGAAPALVGAAASFGMAAVVSLALPRPPAAAPRATHVGPTLRSDPRVHMATAAMAGHRALLGFLLFLLAFALQREGASTAGYATVVGAAGAGAFLGAALGPRLPRALRTEPILVAGYAVGVAGCVAGLRIGFGTLAATVVAAAIGLGSALGRAAFDALLQVRLQPAAQGRAFARAETVLQLAWVAGALLPVAAEIEPGPGLVASAIAYGGFAIGYVVAILLARSGPAPGDTPRG